MNIFRETFKLGRHQVVLETGGMARQASGAVKVQIGDTVVLVTVVAKKEAKDGMDFFPLTVNYQEKSYATGSIPGGFARREVRASEHETLTARLIDRPIRPLFPKGFFNEVQIVATVLSHDPDVVPDIPALIGASASLMISGVPFDGPIAGVRVGFKNGEYTLNPSYDDLKESDLDLVVAGTTDAILMVESEANSLPEEVMLGAIIYGQQQMQSIINAITRLASHVGKPKWDYIPKTDNKVLISLIKAKFYSEIKQAYTTVDKQLRTAEIKQILNKSTAAIFIDSTDVDEYSESEIENAFKAIEKEIVRENILLGYPRIDGRSTRAVRPIDVKIGVLPRAHGSALFTRGETQALVVTTLGSDRESQLIETLDGVRKSRFILHYNFPPYSVGECGMMGMPKRREIGHASLAKKAIRAVFPHEEIYPYVVRTVSEITESNGSSSMATVCGSSLSMMDAGIPVATPVAGIAMGLVKDGERFAVLSDILGDEDHLGDMDFKVAGTQYGITALQMDIKIKGITHEIMKLSLSQAKDGRLHILSIMNDVIHEYKKQTPDNSPQMHVMNIEQSKVRDLIGKGGATIKALTEKTGASIDTSSDSGEIKIFARNKKILENAIAEIKIITASLEIDKKYTGKIVKVLDFGAFVNLLPGKDGLLSFRDLESTGVNPMTMVEGKEIEVLVQDIDRNGKVKLTLIK